jgi:hypothetical protein
MHTRRRLRQDATGVLNRVRRTSEHHQRHSSRCGGNLRSPNKSEPKFDPSGLPSGTIPNLTEASNQSRDFSEFLHAGADDTTTPKVTAMSTTPATESTVGSMTL